MKTRLMLAAIAVVALRSLAGSQPAAPPNGAGDLRLDGDRIQLRYNGALIFDGRLRNAEALRIANPLSVRTGEAIDQVVSFYGRQPLDLVGTITASDQAFPC